MREKDDMINRLCCVLSTTVIIAFASNRLAVTDDELPTFRRVLIDTVPPAKPYYKLAGDLTGDGLPEIVIGGAAGPLVMYTAPNWTKRVIATSGYKGGVNGELADLNSDGRLDIVMGGVVWFEHPTTNSGEWAVHTIDDERIHDVEVADLDGDGWMDVVCRDQSAFGKRGDRVFVYRQQLRGKWTKQIIRCQHGEGLKVTDLNADGAPDIIIGGVWFENDSNTWTEHQYAPDWQELDAKVDVGDINGDGRVDIVVTPSELKGEQYRLSWFEAPGGDLTQSWKEHVLVSAIECVIHSLALGDFNRDGSLDVAAAEMHQGSDPDDVFVLFNAGTHAPWKKQVIDTAGSHDIVAVDLDADGDLDILGANHSGTHPVVMWENQLNP